MTVGTCLPFLSLYIHIIMICHSCKLQYELLRSQSLCQQMHWKRLTRDRCAYALTVIGPADGDLAEVAFHYLPISLFIIADEDSKHWASARFLYRAFHGTYITKTCLL